MSIQVPKITILEKGPTPLQYMSGLSQEYLREFYIKRDDLTPLGGGGSSLRKLEYLIFDAQSHEASTIVTAGPLQSDHCRLTAVLCAKFGLQCIIVAIEDDPEEATGNVLLDAIFGAQVIIKKNDGRPEDDQIQDAVSQVMIKMRDKGEIVYYIPKGGSNLLGMLGYYDCALELDEQAKAQHLTRGTVYVPVDTFSTYLGLYCGLKDINSPLNLVGIAVRPFGKEQRHELHEYFALAKKEYHFDFDDSDMHIETDYVRKGYDIPDSHVRQALYMMARREGILLDPCVSGKVFAALLDMIKDHKIKIGRPILFVHTGGMPQLFVTKHRHKIAKDVQGSITIG